MQAAPAPCFYRPLPSVIHEAWDSRADSLQKLSQSQGWVSHRSAVMLCNLLPTLWAPRPGPISQWMLPCWPHLGTKKSSVQLGIGPMLLSQGYNSKMQLSAMSLSSSYGPYLHYCRHLQQRKNNRALASVACRVYATATPRERASPNGAENTEWWLSTTAKRFPRGRKKNKALLLQMLHIHVT